MSSDEIAISVQNLSKCYQIYNRPQDRLKQSIMPRLRRMAGLASTDYYREFWALKDISFEVKKGETVGVVGRNGSGKSTLLQLICGTLASTAGEIRVQGRVAALLELGAGFNPEFTGRENVYMNGALLGLSRKEIDDRFDDISAFADIGEFIEQPVKTYSSGMFVRLAFAVQAQVDPKILIVDEALSVGDVKFQAKCFERLRQLKKNGTSILLVTHSSEQIVTHCSRAMLIEQGHLQEIGEPRKIVNRYLDILFGKDQDDRESKQAVKTEINSSAEDRNLILGDSNGLNTSTDVFAMRQGYNSHEYRWGDGAATILDYYLESEGKPFPAVFKTGDTIKLTMAVRFNKPLDHPILGIVIKTHEGVSVYATNTEMMDSKFPGNLGKESSVAIFTVNFNCELAGGDFFISIGIATRCGDEIVPHDRRYDAIHIVVAFNKSFFGIANLGMKIQIVDIEE